MDSFHFVKCTLNCILASEHTHTKIMCFILKSTHYASIKVHLRDPRIEGELVGFSPDTFLSDIYVLLSRSL